ncbi:hypothetical protein EMIHUDRAFT_360979, partial [Emiliania huxleyi CCMP1516]|uniref:Uncharacterized protein n=2 Tax=Emiliania huxleyi TaxID=2903 RepID=A0A0D3KXS8_EMIH1
APLPTLTPLPLACSGLLPQGARRRHPVWRVREPARPQQEQGQGVRPAQNQLLNPGPRPARKALARRYLAHRVTGCRPLLSGLLSLRGPRRPLLRRDSRRHDHRRLSHGRRAGRGGPHQLPLRGCRAALGGAQGGLSPRVDERGRGDG